MRVIWFDVCALWVLFEIVYTYIISRCLRVRHNYIFLIQVIVVILTTLGSFFSSAAQNAVLRGDVSFLNSIEVLEASTYLYMAMHILTPLFFTLYVYSLLGVELTKLSEYLGLFMPIITALLLLAATPASGLIFYFDELHLYHRGEYMWVFYMVSAYYMVYSFYLAIAYRRSARKEIIIGLFAFVVFSVAGVIIQLMNSNYKVEDFCNSIVVVMLYVMIERPADYIDSQTDLENANAFYLNMITKYRRLSRFDMVLLTIDNLAFLDKQIGVAKSDLLLTEAANFLERYVRSARIYRLGRGAFVLVLKEKSGVGPEEVMKGIRERFVESFTAGTYSILLFDCCCHIECPKDAGTFDELRHLLSLAVLPGFHKSRHTFEVTDVDVEGDNRKKDIDRILKNAVETMGGLLIKYQPVMNVKTGRFDGVQLRTVLSTKEKGAISRREYLSVAQDNGTAMRIERYIYNSLCDFIVSSGIRSLGIRDFALELPVGALMMKDGSDSILQITDEHGIPHHLITFELTEDVLMHYQGTVKYNIEKLRERGFAFSLVNYGGGYTDAGTILKMPLSSVTLDKDLTMSGLKDDRADTLLQCSVKMLKNFNIRIKAESVENKRIEEYVRTLGCDMMQGYYLSMVYSGNELISFLRAEGMNAV